jgi:hypothetical protein
MPITNFAFPPGMNQNGTPYSRKGRWEDGSLVRYHDGSVRPIGGWVRRSSGGVAVPPLVADAALEAVRDIFTWRDNTQNQNTAYFSNLAAYHMNEGGLITTFTYAGYVPNNASKDAFTLTGFGAGFFGVGAFGANNNTDATAPIPPDRWYSDNFGEVLLHGVRNNGPMQELDISTLTASTVLNAPDAPQAVLVTDERQVMAIGGDGQPRRVQFSEIEDRTQWTSTVSNQAVDITLSGDGRLLNAIRVLNSILILGETDAHIARYIGPPYVYSTSLAGQNCGPIAAESLVGTDRFAVWWGDRNFWVYDGVVKGIECEVIDELYDDLNRGQVSKISAFTNTSFSEVWWLYQSIRSTTGEVDSYVMWDYAANVWHRGRINRTAGVDSGVLLYPALVSNTGLIYNHELTDVFPLGEGDVFIQSGLLDMGAGDNNIAVRYIYPDTEGTSGVSYTILGRQLPNGTEYTYGPYAYQSERPIPTRAFGRLIKARIDFTEIMAEMGALRLDIAQSGTGGR